MATGDVWAFSDWARARRIALGLTQGQAATLAGMSRPNYVAVETGRRAAGPALHHKIATALAARPGDILDRNRRQVVAAVEQRGYTAPRVFGSVARNQDDVESDLDLLVGAGTAERDLLAVVALEGELERILTVPVDVVVEPSDAASAAALARLGAKTL